MLQQLSIVDVVASVMDLLKQNIVDVPIHDSMPKKSVTPMINVTFGGIEPADTKTMYRTRYQILLYAFADGTKSSIPILNLIREIQEALTDEPHLPEGVTVLSLTPQGVAGIQDQPDDSKMAVLTYTMMVSYGFKTKI